MRAGPLLVCAVGVVMACKSRPAPPLEPSTTLRLVDLLAGAEIERPPGAAEPATSVAELGVSGQTVWTLADADGRGLQGGCLLIGAGAGRRLECRGQGYKARLLVRVEPGRYYRLARTVRVSNPACLTSSVLEAPERGLAVRVHHLPGEDRGGTWRQERILRTTASAGRFLVDLNGDPLAAPADCEVLFEDLRVERLELSPAQEVRLLAGKRLAEGADPRLGMALHGQFLTLGDANRVRGADEHNFDFRDAILATAPTRIAVPIRVPPGGRLRFGVALAEETEAGARARAIISVESGGERTELFSHELTASDARWHEASVPLDHWAGREVRILLATTSDSARAHVVWGSPVIDTPRRPDDRPNVILIAVDTLRADRIGSYGATTARTPAIDAIAADGIRFDQVVSASHWTRPSFASLFTGLYPPRHGVTLSLAPLLPARETLTEQLRRGGWATHAILYKSFLYDDGLDQGFDQYFNVPVAASRGERNLARAMELLEAHGDRRFFLFLHFDDPHQPFNHPAELVDTEDQQNMASLGLSLPFQITRDRVIQVDPETFERRAPIEALTGPIPEVRAIAHAMYDDEVTYTDRQIGAFVAELKRRGLYDDALIVFVADHGEMLWDHDDRFDHGTYLEPARLFDSLVRVPLVIKPPASSGHAGGAVVRTQVRAFDLMPTVLELVGLAAPAGIDAQSLVPLFASGAGGQATDRPAFSHAADMISLRADGWKYFRALGGAGGESLFDLGADPGELTDVSARQPSRLVEMRRRVIEYAAATAAGTFVVITGPPGRYEVEVAVDGAAALGVFATMGLPLTATAADRFTLSGTVVSPLWAVLHVRAGADRRLTVRGRGPSGAIEAHGIVRELPTGTELAPAGDAVQVHLVRGGGVDAAAVESTEVDAQKLEALRSVGYVE